MPGISLVRTPAELFRETDGTPNTSNNYSLFVAAHNPVIYRVERRDFDCTFSSTAQGNILAEMNFSPIAAGFVIGQQAWIECDGDTFYPQVAEVYSMTWTGAVGTIVFITKTAVLFSLPIPGLINSNIIYAHYGCLVEMEIDRDPLTGQPIAKESAVFRLNMGRYTNIDLKSWAGVYFLSESNYDYTVNAADKHLSMCFNLTFTQTYTSSEAEPFAYDSMIITNSSKFIADIYGQNMAEYVCPATQPDNDYPYPKFLSTLEVPTYRAGNLFSLGINYHETTTYTKIVCAEFFDRNMNSLGTSSYGSLINVATNHILPPETIPAGTEFIEMWIDISIPSNLYMDTDYVDTNYV